MESQNKSELVELDFINFKRKVKESWGFDLDAYKRPQMERRIRANMDKCGAKSFTQYYRFMFNNNALQEEFLDRVTINVSELFRNPDQFDLLANKIIPELLGRDKNLNVWSAGCSYGAEPYTLAIILKEMAPSGNHNIFASDIDSKMLARAAKGEFQSNELCKVSNARLIKFFDKGPNNSFIAKDKLRNMITYKKHDLLKDRYRQNFDLICCRNVVIYFTDEAKACIYRRYFDALRPGGYLFIGGTERISDYDEIGYETKYPFFYKKPISH
jgi:chemotaxis protein methyltransferase CheR